MTYQVKAEKLIARPVGDVFRALGQGRLFMNCSADSRTMKIDFRVGGKYVIEFKSPQVSKTNFGEFLEIVADKKIVFSWCQQFSPDQKPDSTVTIELFPEGAKTRLVLQHTGFRTQGIADDHQKGWMSGLTDFGNELENGRLRMVRELRADAEAVFATCKNPETFFGFMGDLSKGSVDFTVGGKYRLPTAKGEVRGEFLEIDPNAKIKMSWLAGCGGVFDNSNVTLSFKPKSESATLLELVHDGLMTEEDQRTHRHGWEVVAEKIAETLNRGARV